MSEGGIRYSAVNRGALNSALKSGYQEFKMKLAGRSGKLQDFARAGIIFAKSGTFLSPDAPGFVYSPCPGFWKSWGEFSGLTGFMPRIPEISDRPVSVCLRPCRRPDCGNLTGLSPDVRFFPPFEPLKGGFA
jgi:hypothetical protein